uniref:Uncharacterized protein n=1 Tax=Micrurus carvalhoi TaxID=3147026 RepID=A0A2H6N3N9_9SAUR
MDIDLEVSPVFSPSDLGDLLKLLSNARDGFPLEFFMSTDCDLPLVTSFSCLSFPEASDNSELFERISSLFFESVSEYFILSLSFILLSSVQDRFFNLSFSFCFIFSLCFLCHCSISKSLRLSILSKLVCIKSSFNNLFSLGRVSLDTGNGLDLSFSVSDFNLDTLFCCILSLYLSRSLYLSISLSFLSFSLPSGVFSNSSFGFSFKNKVFSLLHFFSSAVCFMFVITELSRSFNFSFFSISFSLFLPFSIFEYSLSFSELLHFLSLLDFSLDSEKYLSFFSLSCFFSNLSLIFSLSSTFLIALKLFNLSCSLFVFSIC